MKDRFNSIRNIILGIFAIILAISTVFSFFVTVDFPANEKDLLLYRLSCALLFATFGIGLLMEMNIFNLRKKVSLIKTTNIFKHVLFWSIISVLATILFFVPYNNISDDFKTQLNKSESFIRGDITSELPVTTEMTSGIVEQDNNRSSMAETKVSVIEKDDLTWALLSKDAERYKLILTLLGEHFNKGVYVVEDFSDLSSEEKRLVKALFDYANKHGVLPLDFTETFTAFCVGDEFENMILETYENPFYSSLSKSFVISWKSDNTYYIDIRASAVETQKPTGDYVSEESPLTFVYDDDENIVGNCSIVLKKIEIVNTPFKSYGSSSYAKYIRIQATVKNTSSQETYLTSKKDGQFYIGKYYGVSGTTSIGWNNNYKWKVDSGIKSDFGWTLKPNESKDICVTGVFIDGDRLKYSDAPKFDLYFVNDNETLAITIN